MAQHGEAADHVGKLVKVHTVVLVGVQALEDAVHRRLVIGFPEQITKFILQQLFQLSLGQGVLVPLLAGVFIKDANEEGHSLLDVRHDDCKADSKRLIETGE